jgi:hypothetical protein
MTTTITGSQTIAQGGTVIFWATGGTINQYSVTGAQFNGEFFTIDGLTGTNQTWLCNFGAYVTSFPSSLQVSYTFQLVINGFGTNYVAYSTNPITTNTNTGTTVTFTAVFQAAAGSQFFWFIVPQATSFTGITPALMLDPTFAVGYQGTWWTMVRLK